jgi:chloramphenicol-sensitive protein RarD
MASSSLQQHRGTVMAVTAYLIWGFAALYWVRAEPVDSIDILAHRALWSLPFVALCLALAGSGRLASALSLLRQPRTVAIMFCAALLSATNWGIFLWAVTHEHATEASLGYFMLPLLNVVLGITVFRESVDAAQKVAIGFAAAAILLQIIAQGGIPLVALALAMSFGLYGAIRKGVSVESMEGLLLETLFMSPFALAWLVMRDGAGLGQHGLAVDLVLLGAGAMTAIPLMCYVAASRLLPLTALGLVFYIGPTAQLVVAVGIFDEPFSLVQLAAFTLVWVGLVLMTVDNWRRGRALRRLAFQSRSGPA